MDTGRLLFLVVGAVIVLVVGRLLTFSGKRYLANSAPSERGASGSVASLVAMLFYLLTLGILALLAVIPMGDDAMQNFLVRIGVLLIVLAVTYAIALKQLTSRRQDALVAEMEQQYHEAQRPETQHPETVVQPLPSSREAQIREPQPNPEVRVEPDAP